MEDKLKLSLEQNRKGNRFYVGPPSFTIDLKGGDRIPTDMGEDCGEMAMVYQRKLNRVRSKLSQLQKVLSEICFYLNQEGECKLQCFFDPVSGISARSTEELKDICDRLNLELSLEQYHKGSGSSVGAPTYATALKGGDRIPTAMGEDSGEMAMVDQRKLNRVGPILSQLQKVLSEICFDINQEACAGGPGHTRNNGKGKETGDMDVPCSGSHNIEQMRTDHQGIKQHSDDDKAAAKMGDNCRERADMIDQRKPDLSKHQEGDSGICFDINQEAFAGGPGHTSNNGDGKETGDMDVPCSGSSNTTVEQMRADHQGMKQHSDDDDKAAAGKKKLMPMTPDQWYERKGFDDRVEDLLRQDLSWEEKVVLVLNFARCREMTVFDPKQHSFVPTRFCLYFNIAFFDLDKESDFKRTPWFSKVPDNHWELDQSLNIISIRIAESDVPYPIDIYGTVLVRDIVDYRCVYLFKRGRDNPQHITSADDATLTLTGPYRALAGMDRFFFEFNLKIKGEEGAADDKDFSKGWSEFNAACVIDERPLPVWLESFLSKVVIELAPVPFALEASIEVNILNKKSHFNGKITAGRKETGILLLYDSKVAGTETKLGCGGSVSLTRHVVAVKWGSDLVLTFSVPKVKRKYLSFFGMCDGERTLFLGAYRLKVKITWTGVLEKQHLNVLKDASVDVLISSEVWV